VEDHQSFRRFRGMSQGWNGAIETQLRNPTAAPNTDVDGSDPSSVVGSQPIPEGAVPGVHLKLPRNGVPIVLPPNNFLPVTAQSLVLISNVSAPVGVSTAFTFTVPKNYNGWILTGIAKSANNAGLPNALRTTTIVPLLNGNRMWPFVGDPNLAFAIRPGNNDSYEIPVQIRDSNEIEVQIINTGGGPDMVNIALEGWIDQNYVPNQAASQFG